MSSLYSSLQRWISRNLFYQYHCVQWYLVVKTVYKIRKTSQGYLLRLRTYNITHSKCVLQWWIIPLDIVVTPIISGLLRVTPMFYGFQAHFHHDDVIKWKHFPRNWPFVREMNFPHKGQWRGALMFSLIYALINDWVNNREAGDLRRQHGHYDVIVMMDSEKPISCRYVSHQNHHTITVFRYGRVNTSKIFAHQTY